MNFLPFVITFLLLLVIGSSTFFSSVRSTSIEKKILLAQTQAKLTLISEQAKASFKAQKKEAEKNTPPPTPPTPKAPKQKTQTYIEKRFCRAQYDSSKLNLWPLLNNSNPAVVKFIYETSKRLIDKLYREADFYRPDLGDEIMKVIGSKKGESFQDLFPENNERLSKIYYKMLKGTNTSYPALTEYFKIEKTEDNKPPIQFPYASAPILQAALGEDVAKLIFEKEKAFWEKAHKNWALTKEQVRDLLAHHSNIFDINNLDTAFSFDRAKKGLPHAHIEETSKVMAVR
jgi:glycosidase